MDKKKIILVAGGTGGHLFPAIALSRLNKDFDYHFIIDKRVESLALKNNLKYNKTVSSNLNLTIYFPLSIIKIIFACIQSFLILVKHRPTLLIAFGGYTTVPSVIIAKILRVKIILHEQNAIMGKANRFLSKFAENIALTYRNTTFKTTHSLYTGIPIRQNKKKTIQKKYKTILIVGGSQGAKVLSTIIPEIIKGLNDKLKKNLYVIQQVRNNEKEDIESVYRKMNIKFEVKNFFNDIYNEYNKSDIIISRCGSSTLAEIEIFRKFSVLFPLPNAMDNHQFLNALEFKKNNECIIADENNLDIIKISKTIERKISSIKKSKKIINKRYDISLCDLIRNLLNND